MRTKRVEDAFTLIELLVVVAIIAILISILFPGLRAARSQAREVKCRAQLREYARGFQFYFADFNDTFPLADYGPTDDGITTPTWFQLIESYWLGGLEGDAEKDRRRGEEFGLGRCPELTESQDANGVEWEWEYSWARLGYGYNRFWLGWNLFDVDIPGPVQPVFWRRLNDVRQPAECLLVGDSRVRVLLLYQGVGTVGHYLGWRALARRGAGVEPRHGALGGRVPSRYRGDTAFYPDGRGNVAWVDGHVAPRMAGQINDTVEHRRFWDPKQGVGGW